MKKVLTVLGVVFICLTTGAVTGCFSPYYPVGRLDKESRAYVDEVVPIIVASWNSKELINRASPEFLRAIPAEKIELLFDTLSKQMGPMKEYKGSAGQAEIIITSEDEIITANYLARAVFERVPAKIKVQTILRNDEWQILGFRVIVNVNDLY